MADEIKSLGRVLYVEPTLPSNTGGVQEGTYEDSIAHPYEDYSMAVELTIEKTNRYACGDGIETGEVEKSEYSTTDGTIKFTGAGGKMSFLGGTSGVLTTNYTDISMTHPDKNTQETLGIESIQIVYNAWTYPDVTIRFIDVRGATVMNPAEQNYFDTKDENKLGGREISKLYRAFFTFPYPTYTLTVKGFYGMGVRYKLACDKTKLELDASSGNFIITAHFVGHMFRVYSEIPMTFLAIAPYLKEGSEYWEKRKNEQAFKFRDTSNNITTDFLKIPELKLKLAKVAESQEYLSAAAESQQAQENYDEQIRGLNELMANNPYEKLKEHITYMTGWKRKDLIYKAGDIEYSGITVIKLDVLSVEDVKTTVTEFYDSLTKYDAGLAKGYKGIYEAVSSEKYLYPIKYNEKNQASIEITNGKTDTAFGYSYNYLKSKDGTAGALGEKKEEFTKLITRILNFADKDGKAQLVYIIDGNACPANIDYEKRINDLTEAKNSRVKELDDKMNDIIEKALGFRPSIQNLFNLVFAHMDTFTHCFYKHMDVIKEQLDKDRVRRAKTTFKVEDEFTDTERRKNDDPTFYGNYLPPFTGFYHSPNGDKKKVLLWPGDNGITSGDTLEEVQFVKEILSAAEDYADKMDEVNKEIAKVSSANTVLENSMSEAGLSYDINNFIPITPYDFAFKDNGNPYAELKSLCQHNNTDLEGKTLLKFALRFAAFMFSQMPSDETHSSYWIQDYGQNSARLFGEVEAMNFARAVGMQKSSNVLERFIKRYAEGSDETKDERVLLRMLQGKFDLTDSSANKEAKAKYDNVKKCWPLGGANTSSEGLFKEYPHPKPTKVTQSDVSVYTLCNTGLRYLPLDLSNTDTLSGKFAAGEAALSADYNFLPTIISDKKPTGDYQKNKPLNGSSFVVLEAGRYAYEVADRVKALKKDENHPFDFELTYAEDYGKHLIMLPSAKQADDKTYKNEVFRSTEDLSHCPDDKERYEALMNGEAFTKFVVEYPTEVDEKKGKSLYAYELGDKKLYNIQKSIEAKAYLFLFSVPLQGYNGGLVNYKSQNVRKENSAKNGSRNRVTLKMRLLREGALYWREDLMPNNLASEDPIILPDGYKHFGNTDLPFADGCDNLETLHIVKDGKYCKANFPMATVSRRETLKKMFIAWANSTNDVDGFAANEARLRDVNLYEDKDYSNGLDIKLAISAETTGQAYEDMQKLQHFLRNTLCTLCTVIDFYGGNPVVYNSKEAPALYFESRFLKDSFRYFMDGLKKIYGEWVDKLETSPSEAAKEKANEKLQDPFRSKDLRLSIYMTLKSLYDKWLCAPSKGRSTWVLNSPKGDSDFDNFIYMDSYYNKIGLILTANISNFSEWLDSVLPTAEHYVNEDASIGFTHGLSLFEFLAGISQNCGGYLHALPQKIGEIDAQSMMNMFKPLAISDNWVTDSSTFLFLYGYQPSAHLEAPNDSVDMNGWSNDGDGFDLTDDEIIGKIMPDDGEGYKIPAFGVTYAKQNQSFFKNITLTAEDAGVSEVALRATFDIASQANANGTRESTLFGQDIYRVFNQYSYNCGIEMMGNMQITPMMYFQLNNVPMWHGAYMIQRVTHDIKAGDISTKIMGVRQNKFAIPISDMGIIISRKNFPDKTVGVGTTTTSSSGNGGASINGTRLVGAQAGNPSVQTIPIENEDKISETNPVFVFTAAHGNKPIKNSDGVVIDKTKENEWSQKVVDSIVAKMKSKGLVAVRGNKAKLGSYDMTDARNIAKKYGSEKVVSVVPHWNGGKGKYFYSFYGLDNGNLFNIHENSPYLSQCMVNAAKDVQTRSTENLQTPSGALNGKIESNGDLYKTAGRELKPNSADPALNFNYNKSNGVTPPAVLLEDWFADYTTEKGAFDQFNNKMVDGRYVSMYDWLRCDEGINTISDMIVRGCMNYVDWLKGGKQSMDGVNITRSSIC